MIAVLKQLKRGKSLGPDDGGEKMVEKLIDIFNLVKKEEAVPEEWRQSYVVPLFKEEDHELIGNCTGIAFGSCVSKVFCKLMGTRLSGFAEENIFSEVQGGFRPNRSCADQIFVFREVCELRKRKKRGTWLAFMDVSIAYDTVWREGLWENLYGYGVDNKFVRVCKSFHSGVKSSIVIDRKSKWKRGCGKNVLCHLFYTVSI